MTPCWLWERGLNEKGYGVVWTKAARSKKAHKRIFEAINGPVPEGYELDHLCRNRACVNPFHLEVVTHKENMSRGYYAMKTHCPHGHEYSEENTYRYKSGRICKTCTRAKVLERYYKQKTLH